MSFSTTSSERILNTVSRRGLTLALVLLAFVPGAARAAAPVGDPLNVVVTLGVLGDFAKMIGGERVQIEVLTDPRQDPHFVQPRPTLNKRARKADVFIEVGLQLELWAEQVVVGSGNSKIQRGQAGRCIATRNIGPLERPTVLSREMGDVHPDGNPHMWLDPINAREMAANIAETLIAVDPAHASSYSASLDRLQRRIDHALFGESLVEAVGSSKLIRLAKQNKLHEWLERRELLDQLGGWMKKGARLRGLEFVTYHKNWVYLADRFGFQIPIEIESLAGIPPSARHRDRVLKLLEVRDIKVVLQASFYDRAATQFLAGESRAQVVSQPIDCGNAVNRPSYFDLIDGLLDGILAVLE